MDAQALLPLPAAVGSQELQCGRFDLVDRLGAVHRPLRVVGIGDGEAGVEELLDCVTAHGFAGVRGVFLAVMGGEEIHHGRDALERIGRLSPGVGWLQIEQGQEGERGAFLELCSDKNETDVEYALGGMVYTAGKEEVNCDGNCCDAGSSGRLGGATVACREAEARGEACPRVGNFSHGGRFPEATFVD
jgi:hypothetical protein